MKMIEKTQFAYFAALVKSPGSPKCLEASSTVLRRIIDMMKYSKPGLSMTRAAVAVISDSSRVFCLFGLIMRAISTVFFQVACSGVMKFDFSPSYAAQMTPTNMFRIRKFPNTSKKEKATAKISAWLRIGCMSMPRLSTAAYMTSTQPSVVLISKKVRRLENTLSKLCGTMRSHDAPHSSQTSRDVGVSSPHVGRRYKPRLSRSSASLTSVPFTYTSPPSAQLRAVLLSAAKASS
mmetsp:Transcript_5863/g.16421  ORF Transcript_5863/g.16421 Transcript_5863/m.16421 type:complete len:235 (+) Transcript_5863:259-963(+)